MFFITTETGNAGIVRVADAQIGIAPIGITSAASQPQAPRGC